MGVQRGIPFESYLFQSHICIQFMITIFSCKKIANYLKSGSFGKKKHIFFIAFLNVSWTCGKRVIWITVKINPPIFLGGSSIAEFFKTKWNKRLSIPITGGKWQRSSHSLRFALVTGALEIEKYVCVLTIISEDRKNTSWLGHGLTKVENHWFIALIAKYLMC